MTNYFKYDYSYYMHHTDEYDTIADYIWEMSRDEIEFQAIYNHEWTFGELNYRADVIIHSIRVIRHTIRHGELDAYIEVEYEITPAEGV